MVVDIPLSTIPRNQNNKPQDGFPRLWGGGDFTV
jgi:hypothetical protein